uniref:Glycosyltransferase n=1 Tax=Candidatus Methanomethylicus mesodigestus TaxID=1867258 RepID=A0A7C3IXP7_9CREN
MNILHVIPFFTPEQGGSVTSAYNQIRKLLEKRHKVTLLTTDFKLNDNSKYYIENLKKLGVNVMIMKCVFNTFSFFYSPNIKTWLKFNIKNYDVVHIHNLRSYQNNIVMKYAIMSNVPYIVQPHGSTTHIGKIYIRVLKLIYDKFWGNKIINNASGIIALNLFELKQIINHFKSDKILNKIVIIPNGIDLDQYEFPIKIGEFRKKYSINNGKKIILYLGRIHWIKGIDILIKAYYLLQKKICYKDAVLVIAGPDEGYLDKLNRMVDLLDLSDNVVFTGPLYGQDKLAAYFDSQIYVLPSRYETFPNTILEAYALKKAVVASNVCGIKELVIHMKTGLLFRPRNEVALAYAMYMLLNDDQMIVNMGKEGRIMIENHFTLEKTIIKLKDFYLNIKNNN